MSRLTSLLFFCCFSIVVNGQNPFTPGHSPALHFKQLADTTKGYSTPAPVPAFRNCQAVEQWEKKQRQFTALESQAAFEQAIAAQIALQKSRANKDGAIYTIPVVVHVVHNGEAKGAGANISYEQVKSQIDVLNEDFRRKPNTPGYNSLSVGADTEIEFELALRDPQGQLLPEPGVERISGNRSSWNSEDDIEQVLKPATQWDPEQYLNIWTVNYGGALKTNLGYGQFPNSSNLSGLSQIGGLAATDGIVIRYTAFGRVGNVMAAYDGGRTLTHEIGHWLGLRHVWGDGDCNADDYCDDTPVSSEPNYICFSRFNTCPDEPGYDMVANYMNYTPDSCMNVFTADQKARMRAVLEICPRRKELLNSDVHLPTSHPIAFFQMQKTSICEGENIRFTDMSVNQPQSWEWTFINSGGQAVATADVADPQIVFLDYGTYSVRLVVENAFGKDSLYRENIITVVKGNEMPLPFYEDFESQQVLEDWLPYNPDNDRIWKLDGSASADTAGNWSIYFDNYDFTSDPYGNVDVLISNRLNLASDSAAWLSFQVAYARFSDDYSDTLALYYSLDCGESFIPFWRKGGADLATTGDETQSFRPEQDEWREEQISLEFLKGQPSVHLAVANWSGWGNNLYLDDIGIKKESPAAAPQAFLVKKDTACADEAILFSDHSGNFPSEWHWEFPGGTPSSSPAQQAVVQYSSPGSYDVKLTVKNAAGADSVVLRGAITIAEPPDVKILATDSSLCQGDSLTLSANGGYDHYWLDGRGNIIFFGQIINLQPTIDQVYSVFAENLYGCSSGSSINIHVRERPEQPEISRHDDQLTSSPASGYQWWKNDAPINGETSQVLQITTSGNYQVETFNVDGCGTRSEPILAFPSGISESQRPDFEIISLPGKLLLRFHNLNGSNAFVQINDMSGRSIWQEKISPQKSETSIPVTASGIYLISLQTAGQWLAKKVLIK